MLYTDFDLLTDFPEPTLDFLADIPEEKLLLPFPAGSPEECPFDTEVALPTRWQKVDDFFQDITELFQIDPLPVVQPAIETRDVSLCNRTQRRSTPFRLHARGVRDREQQPRYGKQVATASIAVAATTTNCFCER
ncbi:hypothetical protein ZEAMMB73_Zm00001d015002 [Zea mays]|uniref:Uncharacterized protein n=1 Tax=Zea mays TaxID=4577 RepID=A0A1D6GYN2_MAIZE|nr:hypothetical protein ZEAMMB73_Zm00001d015002 [Zea mays]